MARLATVADAPLITSLWNALVPTIVNFWPGPVATLDADTVAASMSPTREFYISADSLAFFRVVVGSHLSDQPGPAEEMDMWIWPAGANRKRIDSYCRELFNFWFSRCLPRGTQPWGQLPPTAPVNSLNWLNNQASFPTRLSPDRPGWTVWEPDPGVVL